MRTVQIVLVNVGVLVLVLMLSYHIGEVCDDWFESPWGLIVSLPVCFGLGYGNGYVMRRIMAWMGR